MLRNGGLGGWVRCDWSAESLYALVVRGLRSLRAGDAIARFIYIQSQTLLGVASGLYGVSIYVCFVMQRHSDW